MSEARKAAHTAFWGFTDATVIHGFGYASKASNWIEALLWILAVFVCIGVAVSDLANLITTYLAEPTTTQINVYYNATGTLTLPNPVVCVDAMLECLNLPSNFTPATEEVIAAFSASANAFNLTSLSTGAIATTIRMFSLMAAMEDISLGYDFSGIPPVGYPPSFTKFFEEYYPPPPAAALVYAPLEPLFDLRTSLGAAGVNFTELMWQIGEFLCQQFTPFEVLGVSLQGICDRSNITWVGQGDLRTQVCMRVNSSFFTMTASSSQRVLAVCQSATYGAPPWGSTCNPPPPVSPSNQSSSSTSNPSPPPSVYNQMCVGAPVAAEQPSFYFDPGGARRYSTSSPDWIASAMSNSSVTISVAVAAVYEGVSTKAYPCSTTDTIAECTLRCTQTFFTSVCGCYPVSPFTLAYNKPARMPYCVNLNYPPVQIPMTGDIVNLSFAPCMTQNFRAHPPTQACLSGCAHECKTTTFTVSTEVIGQKPPQFLVGATFEVSRWFYPDFQQALQLTASSFLASFGGSLGVWLGASFISLAHIPVYLFNVMRQQRLCGCGKRTVQVTSGDIYFKSDLH